MLKTLEEPPGHVIFILATTDPQKVPVTVLSRCLQFNLKQMPPGQVAGHLKTVLEAEKVPFEAAALNLLARAAAGSMRDALSLTDQAIAYGSGQIREDETRAMLGVIDQAYLLPVLEALASGDGPGLMREAGELAARGFSFDAALQDLAGLLHQIALALSIPEAVSEDAPERERLFELARRLDPERVQVLYQIATLGRRDLEWAPDEYAGFSMTLLRMLAFAPGDSVPAARATPPTATPEARPDVRPAPAAARPEPRPAPVQAVAQAANEPLSPADDDWRTLAESLPGATRQLAMQCERMAHDGNTLRLRLPENQKTLLDNFGDKLRAALAEKLGSGLRVEFELAAATDQSPAAARAREQSARQADAEAAIAGDPFVQTLVRECDATVANVRPLTATG
jgi:DNA polymerase-3 subunit gamma/tau